MRSASRVVEVRAQEPCDYASIVTISNVSGSAVSDRDVNRDHSACPSTLRPSTIANVSGTGGVKSRPYHLRFFPKTENDLTGSSSERLGGKGAQLLLQRVRISTRSTETRRGWSAMPRRRMAHSPRSLV